jgi:hypothetical protein
MHPGRTSPRSLLAYWEAGDKDLPQPAHPERMTGKGLGEAWAARYLDSPSAPPCRPAMRWLGMKNAGDGGSDPSIPAFPLCQDVLLHTPLRGVPAKFIKSGAGVVADGNDAGFPALREIGADADPDRAALPRSGLWARSRASS